ncbi:MAG: hypothetical protein HYV34_02545 [Candidatus Kerfeldbacteria bacterium]|nr:hypothetical protein [Candidatus Kerfeldbacteria bacterium]
MGRYRSKHTTYISGARRFGESLADLPHVARVTCGPIRYRGSHSGSRIRITCTRTSVRVTFSTGSGHQDFFAVPDATTKVEELWRILHEHFGGHTPPGGHARDG